MLDFHTAIHYHVEASRSGECRGFFVNHAQLHPDDFGVTSDGLFHDPWNSRSFAENIHDFDRTRHFAQRRIRTPAQHFLLARIYRDNIVTFRNHVNCGKVAWPEWIRGETYHRDPMVALQDS